MVYVFLFIFIVSSGNLYASTSADKDERLIKWSESKEWKRLLHYDHSSFGSEQSLIDGGGFFFAKDGAENPLAELKASIKSMSNDDLRVGKLKLHPQCAFPARYWFLKNRVGLSFKRDVECKKLDEFIERFNNPKSLSVVFSAAYPNNPASMFGHTFLKFNAEKKVDMSHLAINYAASVPPDENPFAFIFFGITGGYPGHWSTNMYHRKIKEYNQSENRDLWEYELSLTPQEVRRVIKHIWEIETNSFFDYYFFDENCSYQVLRSIEAIKPQWDISDHNIYMIPGESIKNLTAIDGAVKDIHFRPSTQTILMARYQSLSDEERREFLQIIEDSSSLQSDSVNVIDAALDYYQFKNIKSGGKVSKEVNERYLELLSKRSKMGHSVADQKKIKYSKQTRPDLGHDSYSFFFSQGVRQKEGESSVGHITSLKLKSSYHDLLNKDLGYRRYSQIDFPSIEFQYDSEIDELRVNELNFLRITSLNPLSFLSKTLSWKVDMGVYTARDYNCLTCRHLYSEVGGGFSLGLMNQKHLVYGMLIARVEAYNKLNKGYRLGPGFDLGLLFSFSDWGKLRLAVKEFWDVSGAYESSSINYYDLGLSFFVDRNFEIRWESSLIAPRLTGLSNVFESRMGLIYFFN